MVFGKPTCKWGAPKIYGSSHSRRRELILVYCIVKQYERSNRCQILTHIISRKFGVKTHGFKQKFSLKNIGPPTVGQVESAKKSLRVGSNSLQFRKMEIASDPISLINLPLDPSRG